MRRCIRLWVAVVVSVALGLLSGFAPAAFVTANATTYIYDVTTVERGNTLESGVADAGPAQFSDLREESASLPVEARGTSTTRHPGVNATEAEAGFPGIKPGAAGGETAGKAFPGSVRQAARGESEHVRLLPHGDGRSPLDHAIPRVQGGNATLENAQTTCGWCNASKGGRTFPVNPPPG
jgi:hypothetical protein